MSLLVDPKDKIRSAKIAGWADHYGLMILSASWSLCDNLSKGMFIAGAPTLLRGMTNCKSKAEV